MRHVRCMFRVLSDARSHDGARIVKLAPTFASRDGRQCEENRSFWEATPSGDAELGLSPLTLRGNDPMFNAGSYLYLDLISDEAEVIGRAEGSIRTDWDLTGLELRPASFAVQLEVNHDGYRQSKDGILQPAECRNAQLFGTSWARGTIQMQINNTEALPFFRFEPVPRGKPRKLVIDFSPA